MVGRKERDQRLSPKSQRKRKGQCPPEAICVSIDTCSLLALQVLEYTLFQPGLFLEYLASPHKTAKHLNPLDTMVDFQNRRAISVQDHEDAIMTLTAVQDLASIVAEAVDYEGEWPVHGGIQGNRLTISQIVKIGEKVRGT